MIDVNSVPMYMWAYAGIVIGLAARTIIPYMQATQDDPELAFQWRYLGTALLSGVFTGFVMMPLFDIPQAQPWQVFGLAVAFAYEANNAANRRVEKYGSVKMVSKEERLQRKIEKLNAKLAK